MIWKWEIQKLLFVYFLLIFATSNAAYASPGSEAPSLDKTELYSKLVSGCQAIDVNSWKHPTRDVFVKYDIKIDKVEICKNVSRPWITKYPIFSVELKRDPDRDDDYYIKFYMDLLKANGKWPFTIVDVVSAKIVDVTSYNDTFALLKEQYRK